VATVNELRSLLKEYFEEYLLACAGLASAFEMGAITEEEWASTYKRVGEAQVARVQEIKARIRQLEAPNARP
jgi:hypothetical protein